MRGKKEKKRRERQYRRRETDKSKCHKEGETEKVFDGWTQQKKEKERKGGREGEAARFMALSPCILPGGTQTLSPCPAFYSPDYCSQINLASYPL